MKIAKIIKNIRIKPLIISIITFTTLLAVFFTALYGEKIVYSVKSVFNASDGIVPSLSESEEQSLISSLFESSEFTVPDVSSSEITGGSDDYNDYAGESVDENISCDPVPPQNTSKASDIVAEGRIVDYTVPATNDNISQQLSELSQKYSDIISLDTIGSSVMGRPIKLVKLGTGRRKACIIGGIHAREHLTVSYVMRCIEELAISYSTETNFFGDYDVKTLLDTYTLYIVPCSNPDGLAIVNSGESVLFSSYKPFFLSQMKANANGVDLNRNFPFMWDSIQNDIPSPNTYYYKGGSAASEPETAALISLCNNNNFLWMLSFHIQGNCIYWRDTVNGEIPGDAELATRLSNMCGFSVANVSSDVNSFGGGFENWFRQAFNRPGMCVELVRSGENIYPTDSYNNRYFNSTVVYEKTKYAIIAGMLQQVADEPSSEETPSVQISSQPASSVQISSQPASSAQSSSRQPSSVQVSSQTSSLPVSSSQESSKQSSSADVSSKK